MDQDIVARHQVDEPLAVGDIQQLGVDLLVLGPREQCQFVISRLESRTHLAADVASRTGDCDSCHTGWSTATPMANMA